MKRKYRHSFWLSLGTVAMPLVTLLSVLLQSNRPVQPIVINVNAAGKPSPTVSQGPTIRTFSCVENNPFGNGGASFTADNPW
jgi:hypothetical protein